MKKSFSLIILVFLYFALTGQLCTKKIVYGKDYYTDPVAAYFKINRATALSGVQKTLERLGYEILHIDEANGRFVTGWKPVTVDSHYLPFFQRKDFGFADGAYYQLIVDLSDSTSNTKIAISTTVKSIAGVLKTSQKLEKKIISQLEDTFRSPQIEMSNVGVEKK